MSYQDRQLDPCDKGGQQKKRTSGPADRKDQAPENKKKQAPAEDRK